MFRAADVYAVWWQPVLKGLGRSQLEVAAAQSRSAQAWITWSRTVASARSPFDLVDANMALGRAFVDHWTQAAPRVSEALTAATEPVTILTIPSRKRHDSISVGDQESATYDRKVA
jgi:hypothetical protein